ncbi:MAG: hypothetical protein OXU66_12325 [Gammaproteobacteria bacterium]|nr:hypothetical protein [Gammaproteobacteria bacterium]MDD9959706.1 hypothetical protein [Gammaproteobacteria bacterium]
MKTALKTLAVLVYAALTPALVQAATCSCAGVPLLSAIDTSSTQPGDLYLNYSTEQHEISDLVRGSRDIRDETDRERSSLSQTLSFSYGLADNWALSGLVSYVVHTRDIGSSFIGEQKTRGLGDGLLLLRYSPIYITPFNRHEVGVGFGVRMPWGEDNAKHNGFTVSEDMHPSSGAWGKIAWASYTYALNQAATMQINASANFTYNDDDNGRGYAFGDEANVGVGFSHSVGTKFSYSAAVRYRSTNADARNGFDIPNTGGEWVDFTPAIQYQVSDSFSVGLSGRVPISRKLDGALQFTTSYSYAVSLSYAL